MCRWYKNNTDGISKYIIFIHYKKDIDISFMK